MSAATERKIKAGNLIAERLRTAGNHKEADDIVSLTKALKVCSTLSANLHKENMEFRAKLKELGVEL